MASRDELLAGLADLIYTDASDAEGVHYPLSRERALQEAEIVLESLLRQQEYPRQYETFGIRFILSEPGELKDVPVITSSVWQGRYWTQIGEFDLPPGLLHVETEI